MNCPQCGNELTTCDGTPPFCNKCCLSILPWNTLDVISVNKLAEESWKQISELRAKIALLESENIRLKEEEIKWMNGKPPRDGKRYLGIVDNGKSGRTVETYWPIWGKAIAYASWPSVPARYQQNTPKKV